MKGVLICFVVFALITNAFAEETNLQISAGLRVDKTTATTELAQILNLALMT